jgi:hypothetical protein
MSAINDLITGAFLGKVVVGTVEKAVLELAELYREIDHYDKICTEVRNELTAAGIPELTEDRMTVLPLVKRVVALRERAEESVWGGMCKEGKHAETIAQLRKENRQLTDALYKEALRSVDAFALIIKVLSADETDRWDALDMEPFVKWIENFPKEKLNGQKSER